MSNRVTVLPTGHEFYVSPDDSLLDGALRAGLALNYGCSNGNCGLCQARLVAGQVEKIRHSDYVLTEAERRSQHILLCTHAARGDLILEAQEITASHLIPRQSIAAKVKAKTALHPDILNLHLQTPRSQRLRFLAGQSVQLQLNSGMTLSYAIASCPCDDRNVYFHFHRDPQNALSNTIFEELKPNDTVILTGPEGDFVLNERLAQPLLFLAHDVGFGPIKSIIENAIAVEYPQIIALYWITADATLHYQHNLCRSWVDALDDFSYSALVAPSVTTQYITSVVQHAFAKSLPITQTSIFSAGSPFFNAAVRQALQQKSVPLSQAKFCEVTLNSPQ